MFSPPRGQGYTDPSTARAKKKNWPTAQNTWLARI